MCTVNNSYLKEFELEFFNVQWDDVLSYHVCKKLSTFFLSININLFESRLIVVKRVI